MNKVAIVILNYNGKIFLENFLPDVIKYSSEAEIIVADNNSQDDSVSYLETNFPSLQIIHLPFNGGFCTGYNLALKEVKAEYFILLNSDVQVTPGWLAPLIAVMDSDPLIAACQPKIKSYSQREYFEYAGAAGGFMDSLGYPFCRGRIFDELEKDEGQYNDTIDIFWATGACMIVRANLFHQFGGFDDDFFAHMEEIDLCWRWKNKGYRICYCGKSEVYHVGGGTLSNSSPYKTFLNFRNNLYLLFKNLPAKHLFFILYFRLILDGLAGIRLLFSKSFSDFTAVIRAHFSFYYHVPHLIQKRKRTDISTMWKEKKQVYPGSIVLQYFFYSKKKFGDLKK